MQDESCSDNIFKDISSKLLCRWPTGLFLKGALEQSEIYTVLMEPAGIQWSPCYAEITHHFLLLFGTLLAHKDHRRFEHWKGME